MADEAAHHARRYRARELKGKVERAGFSVVRMTSFVSLLLPLMIASRLRQRKQEEFRAEIEFGISRALNHTLESILSAQRLMIRVELSFPGGGSLLLVARKN